MVFLSKPLLLRPTLLITLLSALQASVNAAPDLPNASKACQELEQQLPSIVHLPDTSEYRTTIQHYESVSSQNSTCGVAPTTIAEVQTAIKIIGRDDIRSPFAIKSGGHIMNPGFSSTPGVQISLHNFLDFDYDQQAQTVKLGSGWTFDKVYDMLDPYNRTVVGSRIEGIGMGFLYGGGYSWLTNQYGLAIDNVIAYDLVLPNGTYVKVTEKDQPDLWFGVRGGLNNFGIITSATVKTWPTGGVWAGNRAYSVDHSDEVMKALEDFSMNNKDEKAIMNAGYAVTPDQTAWLIFFYYDAPDPAPAPFAKFLSIPSESDTTKITRHSQFIKEGALPPGVGCLINGVPVLRYTIPIIQAGRSIVDSVHTAAVAANRSVGNTIWFAEPFHNHFAHSTFPAAYPYSPSNPVTPSNFWFDYTNAADYDYFHGVIEKAGKDLQSVVVKEGQGKWSDVVYSNYAIPGTALDIVFGESVKRMKQIKRKIDPKNVMSLLGEGFLV